jgi:periplasmic iron binding protein
MHIINKLLFTLFTASVATTTLAAEVPLCALPQINSTVTAETPDPGCGQILKNAKKVAEATQSNLSFINTTSIPPQLNIGTVYLQPITMAPTGMMLPRNQADIHLEIDIHAKANLKARGFAPGDWLPNVNVNYTIQKVGDPQPLACGGMPTSADKKTCRLMAMVASDGAHYGDNVKLNGPGFYIVTFDAHTDPNFGWHTDTDSKVLGTEFVDWHFKQSYLFKWTGVGKLGGY